MKVAGNLLWGLIATSFLLAGCITTSKRDLEEIHVGRPLIFSRESLIKDRENEIAWLEGKLNTVPVHGTQGRRYTREFSALTGSAAVQADPTVIDKYKAQQSYDLDNINRVDEFTGKVHEAKLAEVDSQKILNDKKALYQLKTLEQTAGAIDLIIGELQEQVNIKTKIRNDMCRSDVTSSNCKNANDEVAAALGSLQSLVAKNGEIPFDIDESKYGYGIKEVTKGEETHLETIGGGKLQAPNMSQATDEALKNIENAAKAIKEAKSAMVASEPTTGWQNGLSVTPIENFEDELAYRTRVRDQIAKTKLDDRHDTFGNTLYRLQFPITVVPREENPHWVKVEVELRPEATIFLPPVLFNAFHQKATEATATYKELLGASKKPDEESLTKVEKAYLALEEFYLPRRQFLQHTVSTWSDPYLATMRDLIDQRYRELVNGWKEGTLSTRKISELDKSIGTLCVDDKEKSFIYDDLKDHCEELKKGGLKHLFYYEKPSDKKVYVKNIYDLEASLATTEPNKTPEPHKFRHYAILLNAISDTAFRYNFFSYVDYKKSHSYNVENPIRSGLYLTWRSGTTKDGKNSFPDYGLWRFVGDIITGYVADVYSVNPDESAQRIEDGAEISKVFGVNIAAQFLVGAIGGEMALNYIKGKEKLISTILRKPVVLSLPGSTLPGSPQVEGSYKPPGVKLGWLIGPVFRITDDRNDVEFFQTQTKKTVSADISIPATWTALNVTANVSYINADNLEVLQTDILPIATSSAPLYLPAKKPNFETLFAATPRATMFPDEPVGNMSLNVDKGLSLLITGENVWRAKEVSLGNSMTTELTILGSMEGIQARWPIVPLSACPSIDDTKHKESQKECKVSIRLWSQHADSVVYKDDVKIWWSNPPQLEDNYNLQKIIFTKAGPLIVPFETAKNIIKVTGTNFPIVPSKWMIDYGEFQLDTDIKVSQVGDSHELMWDLDQEKVKKLFDECKNSEVINKQKICHKSFTVNYNKVALAGGKFFYDIIKKE